MGYENLSFATNEVLASTKMNQVAANEEFLFDRFLPLLGQGCVAGVGYGLYIVRFALINPGDASGTGERGATYNRLWLAGNSMAIQVVIPNSVFATTPYFVGHVTHAKTQWGIMPGSIWDESATGYCVPFRDSGGDSYPISSGFGYTALLIGQRKSDPT